MTRGYAAGYIGRSSADANSPGDVSREAQEAPIRALAECDGQALTARNRPAFPGPA